MTVLILWLKAWDFFTVVRSVGGWLGSTVFQKALSSDFHGHDAGGVAVYLLPKWGCYKPPMLSKLIFGRKRTLPVGWRVPGAHHRSSSHFITSLKTSPLLLLTTQQTGEREMANNSNKTASVVASNVSNLQTADIIQLPPAAAAFSRKKKRAEQFSNWL